jgi:tetratricopeptide (TPR) repeat protein
MKTAFATALALLGLSGAALGQDQDPAALKRQILEKVRERLAAHRAALLQKVGRIVEEELSAAPAAAPSVPAPQPKAPSDVERKLREIERKLRVNEDERETLLAERARVQREAADEAVKKEAKEKGPHDLEEADRLFREALKLHENKEFDASIRSFKRIFYRFPDDPFQLGATSAYNAACGYALSGRKDEALDWLETAVKHGFAKFDHIRQDSDLDSLRGEKRYKRLLVDK